MEQRRTELSRSAWRRKIRGRLSLAKREARRRYAILRRYERSVMDARSAATEMGINLRSFFEVLASFRAADGSIESLQRGVRRFARWLDERRAKERLVRTIWGARWYERRLLRLITTRMLTLQNLQRKIPFLDRFWGDRRWKNFPGIVGRSSIAVVRHGRYLTGLFGNDKWKGYPSLFSLSERNLTMKAAFFTATLGHRKWRRYPGIFGKSIQTLGNIAAFLTQTYGAKWKSYPAIFTRSLESLERRTELLRSLYSNKPIGWFSVTLYCVREERIHRAVKKLIRERDDWDSHPSLLEHMIQGRKSPS